MTDPYYFLQEGNYVPKGDRSIAPVKHNQKKFLSSLVPTYLKFDYQGRVLRLDTFSKAGFCTTLTQWACLSFLFVVCCAGKQTRLLHMLSAPR